MDFLRASRCFCIASFCFCLSWFATSSADGSAAAAFCLVGLAGLGLAGEELSFLPGEPNVSGRFVGDAGVGVVGRDVAFAADALVGLSGFLVGISRNGDKGTVGFNIDFGNAAIWDPSVNPGAKK